jgi:predicted transcriptional regulator
MRSKLNVKEEKRGKFEICFDILNALYSETNKYGKASPTRVANKAKIPYDRFQLALGNSIQVGMVSQVGSKLVVTEKGLEYLSEFKKIKDFFIKDVTQPKIAGSRFSIAEI